jgi:RNA polymerase sigma-70 factor (ECF subfamily)
MNNESSYDLELLLASLKKLSTSQREAIVLFEISGLSLKEIQEIQGGSISGVKSRLTRARDNLRRLITDSNLQKTDGRSAEDPLRNFPNNFRIQPS